MFSIQVNPGRWRRFRAAQAMASGEYKEVLAWKNHKPSHKFRRQVPLGITQNLEKYIKITMRPDKNHESSCNLYLRSIWRLHGVCIEKII